MNADRCCGLAERFRQQRAWRPALAPLLLLTERSHAAAEAIGDCSPAQRSDAGRAVAEVHHLAALPAPTSG
jgi:hypothetical protein